MATIHVCAERTVEASAETVYGYLADMREHHPRFLPRAFSECEVESGGVGHGTITRFRLTAGGGTREYRMEVAESQPGRVLTESDTNSSLVTTVTVTPTAPPHAYRSPRPGRAPQASGVLRAAVCSAGHAGIYAPGAGAPEHLRASASVLWSRLVTPVGRVARTPGRGVCLPRQ